MTSDQSDQLRIQANQAEEEARSLKKEFKRDLRWSPRNRRVSDRSFRKQSPLAWGQSIDSLWTDLPDALSLVDLDERIRPSDASGEIAELRESVDDDGVRSLSFVASKRERGEARWSEDRVGFQRTERGLEPSPGRSGRKCPLQASR